MVKEYTYSPHVDFYIDMIDREHSYDMGSFHTHHKYDCIMKWKARGAILLRIPPISSMLAM